MSAHVRVYRNRHPQQAGTWLVSCALCAGTGEGFFDALCAVTRPLGYAQSWRAGWDFAQRHALDHEATRCTTCLHLPSGKVPSTPKEYV